MTTVGGEAVFAAHRRLPIRSLQELRDLGATLAFVVIVVHTFLPAWLGWTDVALPTVVRWIGAAGVLASLTLIFWIERAMTQPVLLKPDRRRMSELVTDGPYGIVRHPMYATEVLAAISLALLAANWVIGLLAIGTIAHLLLVRLPREELDLLRTFGERYTSYAMRTPRLVPSSFDFLNLFSAKR